MAKVRKISRVTLRELTNEEALREYGTSFALVGTPPAPAGSHTWRGSHQYQQTTFDYVFVRGLEAATAELVEVSDDTSDHWPVRIELSLP
jgi:endonuclease/exonuclease/phosphatase family metal-dependent hydrolase